MSGNQSTGGPWTALQIRRANDGNREGRFRERLFAFLEGDGEKTISEIRQELSGAGIDPDVEIAWVRKYVRDH